jgi:radical SAM-linked protein
MTVPSDPPDAEPRGKATGEATSEPPSDPRTLDPRQRWRLMVARAADAPRLAQRETVEAWEVAIEAAGLPLARTDGARSRPRIAFGAPLSLGMSAEAELIDLVLTERWPLWRVREALVGRLPEGWRLIDIFDVWLAGPPLAGRVAAADYRVALDSDAETGLDAGALVAACTSVMAARRLMRRRPKGDTMVEYDLRPLLVDVRVDDPGPPATLTIRTRFHPELGTGRPEEVVAAVGDEIGRTLVATTIVRERLVLADELG